MSISSSATGLRPGVCTSTTRPTTPYTGMTIFETDTGYLRVWDGSAWDYLSKSQDGTTNLPISDIGRTWLSWTPTWTAVTTDPAIGNGTLSGRYLKIGQLVIAEMLLIPGSTTTFGSGRWRFTFPVNASDGYLSGYGFRSLGFGRIYDTSAGATYTALPLFFAGETSRFSLVVSGSAGQVNSTTPMTWASTDEITIQIMYEVA